MPDDSERQKYTHPPIVEAIIEVRLSEEIGANRQNRARDLLSPRYPNSAVEAQAEAKIDFPNRSVMFLDLPSLFRFTSADQTEMCTLSSSGAAWVRRAPYEGWTAFRERIVQELPVVLKAFGEPRIQRIGLRYINRIDVPRINGLCYYEDYINFRIDHGEILEPTTGFTWQVVKEFRDVGLSAIVQSGVAEEEVPGMGAVSFDIDVFCDKEVPQNASGLLEKLNAMRDLKNTIFEAGISNKAREEYSK